MKSGTWRFTLEITETYQKLFTMVVKAVREANRSKTIFNQELLMNLGVHVVSNETAPEIVH